MTVGAATFGGTTVDTADSDLTADDFMEIVGPHLAAMTRLALRLAPRAAADDVVQEALVRAWRHRRSFDPRRGSLSGWLLTIVANEAHRAVTKGPFPIALRGRPDGPSIEDQFDLEAALHRLTRRQRLAVDYYYFVGLSISDTAQVMGCAEGTVKSTLADARARLRAELDGRR